MSSAVDVVVAVIVAKEFVWRNSYTSETTTTNISRLQTQVVERRLQHQVKFVLVFAAGARRQVCIVNWDCQKFRAQ